VDLASDPASPAILRLGAVSGADVERVIGRPVRVAVDGDLGGARVPGTLAAHYAPRAGVELVTAEEAGPRAAALHQPPVRRVLLIAPREVDAPALSAAERVDAPADPAAFARELYILLREADARRADVALVVPPPASGLGAVVRDRLRRAAGGRGGV
jgi:L-threonylcarbamoyladenylate synthase